MIFNLPPESDVTPSLKERVSVYFLAFIPWIIIYETFIYIGAPNGAFITNMPFEEHIPVWEFTVILYSFALIYSLLVPLVAKTSIDLGSFVRDIWFTIIIVAVIYTAFPFVVKQRAFIPHTFLGKVILFERSVDGESGALPSCHVIWAFLAAEYFSRSYSSVKWAWYGLAVLISASCITTGAHSIADVAAGIAAYLLVHYRKQIWIRVSGMVIKKKEISEWTGK